MRSELASDPDVIEIAALTNLDEFGVVGRLHTVWSWLDQHSDDGTKVRIASAFLDRLTACPGFAEALRAVGWLDGRDGAVDFPGYTEHNGDTAKARAMSQKRVQKHRYKRNAVIVTDVTPAPLPEKSREEKISSHTRAGAAGPPGGLPGEQPSLAAFQAECGKYLLPAWYAEQRFNDFAAKGWRSGKTPLVWREAIRAWLVRDYENAGKPLKPHEQAHTHRGSDSKRNVGHNDGVSYAHRPAKT